MQGERKGQVKGGAYLKNIGHLLIALSLSIIPAHGIANEVDDILALKSKNRDIIKSFSAEYSVETTQKSTGKTGRMRYRIKMDRLSTTSDNDSGNSWRIEKEIYDQNTIKIIIEGDNIHIYRNGKVKMQKIPDNIRSQIRDTPEMSLCADLKELKKNYSVTVIGHNNPLFGVKTKTIKYKFDNISSRLDGFEEDVESDGFVRNTRIFQEGVLKVETLSDDKIIIKGIPFSGYSKTIVYGFEEIIVMRTKVANIKVELR